MDLRYLWATRRTSGFPWPRFGVGQVGGGWWMALTGHPSFAVIPRWKQVVTIPLRPWRYVRMVRGIARTRAIFFNPAMYDDVP